MLYTVGAMNELVKQMDKYKINICAVQEIGCPGKGTVIKKSMRRITTFLSTTDRIYDGGPIRL